MDVTRTLGLFEAYGIELEYMIVSRDLLRVLPVTDQVLHAVAGEFANEVPMGEVSWSNELALHVIELKCTVPMPTLDSLGDAFHANVQRVNEILAPLNGRLMPTGMHPLMDPFTETKLWPHDYNPVYIAFDRIFSCAGHGWSNLQSMHINLPFGSDEEFGRLHAAIRLVLPLLPALAASTPAMDGKLTGLSDSRLNVYRSNCKRVPQVTGLVIPEPVFTKADYLQKILEPMYAAIAPLDPEGILQEEFLNARGAIARFDRDAIEIRVIDTQECPKADLAVATLVVAVVRALVEERWCTLAEQQAWAAEPLAAMFMQTVGEGERAVLDNADYLGQFGMTDTATAADVWRHLAAEVDAGKNNAAVNEVLNVILTEGPLSRRIAGALGQQPKEADFLRVYGELCACLQENRMFVA